MKRDIYKFFLLCVSKNKVLKKFLTVKTMHVLRQHRLNWRRSLYPKIPSPVTNSASSEFLFQLSSFHASLWVRYKWISASVPLTPSTVSLAGPRWDLHGNLLTLAKSNKRGSRKARTEEKSLESLLTEDGESDRGQRRGGVPLDGWVSGLAREPQPIVLGCHPQYQAAPDAPPAREWRLLHRLVYQSWRRSEWVVETSSIPAIMTSTAPDVTHTDTSNIFLIRINKAHHVLQRWFHRERVKHCYWRQKETASWWWWWWWCHKKCINKK